MIIPLLVVLLTTHGSCCCCEPVVVQINNGYSDDTLISGLLSVAVVYIEAYLYMYSRASQAAHHNSKNEMCKRLHHANTLQ
jgi:hypothetical protein